MLFYKRDVRNVILLVVVLILLWLTGCAPPKTTQDIVWPLPPDFPRILYVMTIHNEKDIFGFSAKEILFGAKPIRGFEKPYGVFIDDANGRNRIFVSDSILGVVFVFDKVNKKRFLLRGLGKPMGVAVDSFGRAFVADAMLSRVMVFDRNGKFLTAIGKKGELERPVGIAINEDAGKIYVVDSKKHRVSVFDFEEGKLLFTFGERGMEEGQFNFPSNIAIDKEGQVWIVDTINGRIQVFDQDGNFIDTFGRLGDAPGTFGRPKGIAIDQEGHIYVVDAAFNNVQIFNDEGQVLLVFGGYGEDKGHLILPAGIAIDKDDQIYVVEQWNKRLTVYQFLNERYQAEHPDLMKRLTRGLKGTLKGTVEKEEEGKEEKEKKK